MDIWASSPAKLRHCKSIMNSIKSYFKIYCVALSSFLLIDMVWIGFFANSFYRERLGYLLSETPNILAAAVFYLIFNAGLVFFAVRPGLKTNKILPGILKSALYGLITYGTYDLTNLALIKDWPISVTIVDMIWGVLISITVGAMSINFGKRLKS